MPTVLELQERRAGLTVRFREIIDTAEQDDRDLTDEEKANLDTAETDIRSLDSRIERQEKLERTPAHDPGPRPAGTEVTTASEDQYRTAINAWARRGNAIAPEHREVLGLAEDEAGRPMMTVALRTGWSSAEQRALSTMSMITGGATVAMDNRFAGQLEDAMLWYGGMREVATILTTDTGADLPYPTATDTANTGEIVASNGAFTTTVDPTFGAVVFKAYKYDSGVVLVPWELLQDSAIDISAKLAEWLGTRIARLQNTHWTVGTGSNAPTGIMQLSVQGRAGATGTSTSVTWDDLIMLEHAVNRAYRDRGRYMFHDQTLRDIRRIKDGNGNYIWQPAVTAGAPNMCNGYPYTINNDMATMAASANSIVFGDLSKYFIRQVKDVQILRLNELYAGNGRVGFLAWARADGHLIDAGGNPVQHFTNSAS